MNCPNCGTETPETAGSCPDCGRSFAVPAGTVLADRYQIQALLGSGGLGRVYRAHDRMLEEVVAVKVLHPEAARSRELSKRFRSEIKLARKVRHRNVCAIHEYGEQGPYRYVVMELVDGVDLHRVIRERGPLPAQDAFDVAIQVAKGLSAIHEAGVLHRDLKTPNIMKDARGVVRILDFGIAKLLNPTGKLAVTAVQRVVGTPEYMSPEQIRGDDLDERSDVYALGVVIFEVFTGIVPFQGKSPLDTLLRQVNDPPPLYGEAATRLPTSLVPVLRRALAKNPRDRHPSARGLLEALRGSRRAAFPEVTPTPPDRDRLDAAASRPGPPPVIKTVASSKPPLPQGRGMTPSAPLSAVPSPPIVAPPLIARPPVVAAPPPASSGGAQSGGGVRIRGWSLAAVVLLGLAAMALVLTRRSPPSAARTVPTARSDEAGTAVARSEAAAPSEHPLPAASAALASPPPSVPPEPTPQALVSPGPPRPRARPTPTPPPTPSPTPTATPPPSGGLDVDVRPGADVEVGGRGVGRAPLQGLPLDPGVYVVRLQHPDYWPLTRKIPIEAGKTERLEVDLSWEGVPRARSRVPPYAVPVDGGPDDDPYFQRGLRQLAEGDFQEAVLTLEPVVQRMQTQGGKPKVQARAEFYLGCAYLELNRQALAKERFQSALKHDGSLKLPPGSLSPKVASFFGTVREGIRKKP
jgi:eukaryotic-like serine/threonine-protein kinase